MLDNSKSSLKAQTKDATESGCRQQSIYFIQTSSEDTQFFTICMGRGEKWETQDHVVPQSTSQKVLEIVRGETQLINHTESLGTVSFL